MGLKRHKGILQLLRQLLRWHDDMDIIRRIGHFFPLYISVIEDCRPLFLNNVYHPCPVVRLPICQGVFRRPRT